ncbi:SUMO protease [Phytophthora palmivora]|uniref:SUMO protease n=1 Tax=Phytophthora palmivora TaxID=4796 RepID=A0A2P4Y535_9STRA|nr:SUMO protease [Phytophthora palmivora]
MPGSQRHINYYDEMNQFLGMTSEWFAEILLCEYKFAADADVVKRYCIDDEELCVTLKCEDRNHRVDKFNWMCSCEFSSTMKLPCRHAMIYRKHVAKLLTIPYSSIPDRCEDAKRKKQMTERDKFKSAQNGFSRITSELTDLPDDKFKEALDTLENWWGKLRQGEVAMDCLETKMTVEEEEQMKEDHDSEMPPTQIAETATILMEERDPEANESGSNFESARTTKEKKKTNYKKVTLQPFNPRTRVGRPQKDRAAESKQRGEDRKEYNNGANLRNALRGDDVIEVEDFIRNCEPPLEDLSSFLNTFESDGMMCYSWLMGKIDVNFEKEGANVMAKRLLQAWPYQRLHGFAEGFHLDWTPVYCARRKCLYNDNFINAFTLTLAAKYENNATIFLPTMTTPAPDKGKLIPPVTLSKLAGSGMDVMLMPLNVNDNHWTCIVVDNPKQTIYCYDSLDKRANMNLLTEIAGELIQKSLSQRYSITLVHSPIQRDSDNCGLLVCRYFWRRFDKEVGNNYSPNGLMRRRWDILRAVLDFSNSSKGSELRDFRKTLVRKLYTRLTKISGLARRKSSAPKPVF